MTPISTVCNEEERQKIARAREEREKKKDIDYEAKEYHGSYADDDREEEEKQCQ